MCRVPYDNIIYKHSYVKLKLGLLDEKTFLSSPLCEIFKQTLGKT